MAVPYRFAVCNELFSDMPFLEACRQIRKIGYQGIEIAPFTLAADPGGLTQRERAGIRNIIEAEGLEVVGLHWLLASPPGLHATTPDEGIRKHTWEYIHRLIDLCADLAGCREGGNGVMVFGSPQQRSAVNGMSSRQATDVFIHELAHAAPYAESCGVQILIEALPANQSNVINSLADAVSIVKQIGSPAVQTMFDTHNAVDEKEVHSELLRHYYPHIRHVHVNELDGREPGTGEYNFDSLLNTLSELGYSRWISLEVFDFSRNPSEVAVRALDHLANQTSATALSQIV